MTPASPTAILAALRRLLLGLLLFGLVGTATELLLIGHDEDCWQMIPLVAIAIAALVSLGLAVDQSGDAAAAMVRLFQAMMVLLILSGAPESVLHYRANMEFKLEMDPVVERLRAVLERGPGQGAAGAGARHAGAARSARPRVCVSLAADDPPFGTR